MRNLVYLKLVTGEDIIGMHSADTDPVEIHFPLQIVYAVHQGSGATVVDLIPWAVAAKFTSSFLYDNSIVAQMEPSPALIALYRSRVRHLVAEDALPSPYADRLEHIPSPTHVFPCHANGAFIIQ